MSRFANPAKTERYQFPDGCKCPGTPHDGDWMALRTELGAEDVAKLSVLSEFGAVGGAQALGILVVDWNLLDEEGQPAPCTPEYISRLWADLVSDHLNEWIDKHVRQTSLPNGSGGRSPNGSSATASRTRAPRSRASSTTSS